MFDYATMVKMLEDHLVDVIFTKVDGSTRHMVATLNQSYLPEEYRNNESRSLLSEGDGEHESISVWDVELGAWRKFRVSSVKSFHTNVRVG